MTKINYFAYGSNLLSDRFLLNNQGIRRGIGLLKDYMLGFNNFIDAWEGGVVSIIRKEGRNVMGAIWEIDLDLINSLDVQEGFYHRFLVDVELTSGEIVKCHTYEFDDIYMPKATEKDVSYGLLPSSTYLKVIVKGAIESNLPEEYVDFLRTILHNGRVAKTMEHRLQLNRFEI